MFEILGIGPEDKVLTIVVDTGKGQSETIQYDPDANLQDLEIVLDAPEATPLSADEIAAKRQQKAKKYAKQREQQKRRRQRTPQASADSQDENITSNNDKQQEIVFVVEAEETSKDS